MKEISVYNISNLPTCNFELFKELQQDFKVSDPLKETKLENTILTRGFKYAFVAWKDETGQRWIVDAHRRKKVLANLQNKGFTIPNIPYYLIQAKDKKEAVEEIAFVNSHYADINPNSSLFDDYGIDLGVLDIELPEFFDEEPEVMGKPGLTEDDAIPEEVEPVCKEGDIWQLGDHRLLCGDSTDAELIKSFARDVRFDQVVTDPPYNIDYEGKTKDKLKIKNDKLGDEEFYNFLLDFYKATFQVTKEGASYYVFHSDSFGHHFRRAFIESGHKLSACLIWVKNSFVLGRSDYHWRHEPILYGWKKGASHSWYSNRKQSTILEFDKPLRNDDHPTMKPVSLLVYLIYNNSKAGDIVYDPFLGSGSTLIACEKTQRNCYGIELDPKYCDVIVKRWEDFTGLKSELINPRDEN